jgi:hypothetical protein
MGNRMSPVGHMVLIIANGWYPNGVDYVPCISDLEAMAYHAPLVVQFGIKQNPSVLWRDITTCSNLYTRFWVMNHDRFRTQVHSVTITKPEYLMTKTAERSEQIILKKNGYRM